jgi:transposase
MIPATLAVFVCTLPVDLRGSFDRLAAVARAHVHRDPLTEVALYLFLNRARTHVKVLWWDRTGWCLLYKRLERGTFRLPTVFDPGATHVEIGRRELELLLEGMDLPKARPRDRPPSAQHVSRERSTEFHKRLAHPIVDA